jgi:hypothetical protein
MRFGSVEVIGGPTTSRTRCVRQGTGKSVASVWMAPGNKVWIDVSEARLRGEDMSGERTYFVPASFFLSLV